MQKARVANPGPAGLLVINPKRGSKTMAKRRRKTTTARPTARRKTTTRRRKANPTVFSSSRRVTRVTRSRKRVSRKRNPSPSSLITQAASLALGITAVGFAQGFVPPIGGVSPIAVAGRQAGTGYLIGLGMEKFNVLRGYAKEIQLAGFALGAGTLINAYVLPLFGGFFRPAASAQPAQAGGMADLVTLPAGNYDPYYGSTPKIANAPVRSASKAATLKGLLTMPVMPGAAGQRFGR